MHHDSFYIWGGATPYFDPPDVGFWKFTTDGHGSGTWTESEPTNVDTFSKLVRPGGAARTTCNGFGFSFGDYVSRNTDPRYRDNPNLIPVPGLLTYNLETGVWNNKSAKTDLNSQGTSGLAAATCLEDYGQGVFLPIGGELMPDPTAFNDNGQNQVEMSILSMYDIGNDKWLNQSVSGETPPRRDRNCVGIAAGDHGPDM